MKKKKIAINPSIYLYISKMVFTIKFIIKVIHVVSKAEKNHYKKDPANQDRRVIQNRSKSNFI